jgi:hypothetical protein
MVRSLGHFVGDLTLHVGFAEDIGGNGIDVRWDRGTGIINKSLHNVWDSEILRRAGLISQTEDGPVLNAEISAWCAHPSLPAPAIGLSGDCRIHPPAGVILVS